MSLFKKHLDVNIQMIEEPMIHLTKMNDINIHVKCKTNGGDYKSSINFIKNKYSDILLKAEIDELKKLEHKYNHAVFYLKTNSVFNVTNKNDFYKNVHLKTKYKEYRYSRDVFLKSLVYLDKLIEKQEKAERLESLEKNILLKIFKTKRNKNDYRKEKETMINNYFKVYFDFFKEQFIILKLSNELFDELMKSYLLASRFDMSKTIILLDNLIEKIYMFLFLAKKANGTRMFDKIVEESVPEFNQYINKVIKELKNTSEYNIIIEPKELTDEEIESIIAIKTLVFKDND